MKREEVEKKCWHIFRTLVKPVLGLGGRKRNRFLQDFRKRIFCVFRGWDWNVDGRKRKKKVEKESGWDILHELDCEIKSDLYSSIYFYSCLRYFFAVLLRRKFGNRLRINNASNKLNYVNRQLRIHVITSVGKWRNKAISSRLLIVVMSASSLPMMISSRRHL